VEDAGVGAEGTGPGAETVFDGAEGTPAVGWMAAHGAQGAGAYGDGDGQGFASESFGGLSDGAGGVEGQDFTAGAGRCGAGDVVQSGVRHCALQGQLRGACDKEREAAGVAAEGGAETEEGAGGGDGGSQQVNGTGSSRERGRKTANPQIGRGDSGEDQGGKDRGMRAGRLGIPGFKGETWDTRLCVRSDIVLN